MTIPHELREISSDEQHYSYGVYITRHGVGSESPWWGWQVDLEAGNGVLDWGSARTRRAAARRARRAIGRHARHRGDKIDYWWRTEEEKTA